MNQDGTVNGQIIDSTSSIVTLLTGQAPSQSFGMLDAVMVETMAMAMHNAVNRQQSAGMIGSAAVTAACAKLLAVPVPPFVPPPPAPPPVLPTLPPLPGPTPVAPPEARVAAASATAESAIDTLKAEAAQAVAVSTTVQNELSTLISEAQEVTPAPPPAVASTPTPPSVDPAPPSPGPAPAGIAGAPNQ